MTAIYKAYLRFPAAALTAAAVCAALAAASANAQSQQGQADPCGTLRNHFGPFDYRVQRGEALNVVEKVHFTPGIENLSGKGGTTTVEYVAGDIGYTLRVFPNHHRALLAMTRLSEQRKTDQPPGAGYSTECYFIRAMRFVPNDTVVRGLYAQYLVKHNRKDDAIRQLDIASELAADNPLSHYSIGLLYFDLGRFDRALDEAHKAKALGLERQELAQLLKRANKWQEPVN